MPTRRGYGDSEQPLCCYRIIDFAADAVALLDTLGIEQATVVGHSMGSFVAQRAALEWPARVKRLVLIGSGTTARTEPVLEFNEVVQKLTDPIATAFVREFQESTVFTSVPSAFMDGLVRESEKLPARLWRDVLAGLVAPEAQPQSERIQATTLIVWGDKDAPWTQLQQEALQRAIGDSRLITYTDLGHSPHWEQPARFAADLMDFLNAPLRPAENGPRTSAGPSSVATDAAPGANTSASRVRVRRIRLSTGVELQVAETGAVNGESVLFLHGLTDSWFSMTRVLDILPPNMRAIAPMQRGHGDSERPTCWYRVTDFAADAVALLDALGIERATIVGHSMGSFVAQRIAVDFAGSRETVGAGWLGHDRTYARCSRIQ